MTPVAGNTRVHVRRDTGTAGLETVALVWIVVLVGSLVLQLGVAAWTTVAANTAARSAARAVTLGGDPVAAVNRSLPGSLSVESADVDTVSETNGVRVTVTVTVPRVSIIPGDLKVTRDAVMPDIKP